MRILHHAVNGTGLGHLHRQTNVAAACRAAIGSRSLVFTNAQFLAYPRRWAVPVIGCPVSRDERLIEADAVERAVDPALNAALFEAALSQFDPDIIMFDTALSRTLMDAADTAPRALKVAVVRQDDVVFDELFGTEEFVLDHVFVCHEADDFDAGHPVLSRSDVTFVGPIGRPVEATEDEARDARERLGLSLRDRLLVISCGGGGYHAEARRFIGDACSAAETLRQRSLIDRIAVLPGPYFGADTPIAIDRVDVLPPDTDVPVLLRAATATVTHGGYNSVHEAGAAGVRALVVPARRTSEDQAANLPSGLRGVAGIAVVEPTASASDIAACLQRLLDGPAPVALRTTGGQRVAEALAKLAPQTETTQRVSADLALTSTGPLGGAPTRQLFHVNAVEEPEVIAQALRDMDSAVPDAIVEATVSAETLRSIRANLDRIPNPMRRVILRVEPTSATERAEVANAQNSAALVRHGFVIDVRRRSAIPRSGAPTIDLSRSTSGTGSDEG